MKATIQICGLFGVAATLTCAVVGCRRLPPPATVEGMRGAVCTFWRDDGASAHLIGGGVFLELDDDGRRRMFCLTARHVATMPPGDGSTGGFFRHPARMYLSIEGLRGSTMWKHGIAPERWNTGEQRHDLAWFELSEDEMRYVKSAGGLPIIASTNAEASAIDMLRMSGDDGVVSGAAAMGFESWRSGGLTNNASILAFVGLSRDRDTAGDGRYGASVTNVMAECRNLSPQSIKMSFDGHKNLKEMQTSQVIAEFKTEKGDSGMPVFVTADGAPYPMLIGIVSTRNDQFEKSGIMPIDEALRNILNACARRIVEMEYLQ